jgi:hypothetical protein
LKILLPRAAAYVQQFERDFSSIVTDETYDQQAHQDWRGSTEMRRNELERHIRSEMLFMRLPGQGLAWISARNVLEVDGTAITDSRDRIERVIGGNAEGLAQRLLSLADEGARFNIGTVQRNFNDPILPLLFLDPEYQPRFKFRLEKLETMNDVSAVRTTFKESERPTVIRETGGKDIPLSGAMWIRPDDGAVVRTDVAGETSAVRFNIRIDYRHDARLDTWVPGRMEEHYTHTALDVDRVDCVAVYSNARRFETSGRVVK